MAITFKPYKAFPAIPTIGDDVESHTKVLEAVKEALLLHQRQANMPLDSFVRLRELVDAGVLTMVPGTETLAASAAPEATTDHGLLSGP